MLTSSLSGTVEYLSYALAHNANAEHLAVVDSHYPRGLVLAHAYEERVPAALKSNTSTECVLKWLSLDKQARTTLGIDPMFVTCNHWDIDGFLAVWAMINPAIAERHHETLIAAAELGDFRSFDPNTPHGLRALKICSLLNTIEANTFCLPFGDLHDATIEYEVAERKFQYFLPKFAQWLERIDDYTAHWSAEFVEVMEDCYQLDTGAAQIEEIPELGISILRAPKTLHYYASFSRAKAGAVLSIVESEGYAELEYKYETRVGRTDRSTAQRRDLTALANYLTSREGMPNTRWVFDNINEGGPILRPEKFDAPLSRADRYQNLKYRLRESNHARTSIPTTELIELVTAALRGEEFVVREAMSVAA